MRFKLHLNETLTLCTIPMSQLHTLKEGLSHHLNLTTDYLDENVLWDIQEGRLGEKGCDILDEKNTSSIGKRGIAPLVTAYLSDELTSKLAAVCDHVSPLVVLESGPRSMRWNVLLVPDALMTVHEYPFMEHRGYLRVISQLPRDLSARMFELDMNKFTPPSNPECLVQADVDVDLLPQNEKFLQKVTRGKAPRIEPIPNILWFHKQELRELYRGQGK